jgi:hypothetical protein
MTVIASKLPPKRVAKTYFSSGRAAFAYLVGEVIRPRRVWLPTFTCWSLVTTMLRRFPQLELEFYGVDRSLKCSYPERLAHDELLVFIHFFGHGNLDPLPGGGVLLEDVSHSYLSSIPRRGDFVFGSLRKLFKVGDGGFIEGFHNPVYEPARKLDTWLRYEASDWRDVREAENMLDRDWALTDMSSQSLAVVLGCDESDVRTRRVENERHLFENFGPGRPAFEFREGECPLLHQRIMATTAERDSLRQHLAAQGIFTSIHWPTHPSALAKGPDIEETLWLEAHSLAIPVGSDYGLEEMGRIVAAAATWSSEA